MTRSERAEAVFENIKTRRAVRSFTDQPVSVADLRRIVEAARWASSAGNRRLHRFYVTRDPEKIDLINTIGPGFYGSPAALIVICTDLDRLKLFSIRQGQDVSTFIDVGTAAMNMQLMAHALGLGTTPVTSVSRSGFARCSNCRIICARNSFFSLGIPHRHHQSAPRGGHSGSVSKRSPTGSHSAARSPPTTSSDLDGQANSVSRFELSRIVRWATSVCFHQTPSIRNAATALRHIQLNVSPNLPSKLAFT